MNIVYHIVLALFAVIIFLFGLIISDKAPTAGAIMIMTSGACWIALFLGTKKNSD